MQKGCEAWDLLASNLNLNLHDKFNVIHWSELSP